MIDLQNEEKLTLSRARQLPELQRDGLGPHIATLTRWIVHGVRGVKLESCRQGGRRVVTREAIRRFLDRINGYTPTPPAAAADGHARAEAVLTLARI
jgi:hypothetical protein